MAGEFVPKEVKETGSTDMHGNMGYSVIFSNGENAFFLAKKAPVVGVPEWGEIIDAPKKSGQGTYKRFKRMMKEDGGFQAPQSPPVSITARVEELEKRVSKIEQRYSDTPNASFVAQTGSQSLREAPQTASDYIADEIDLGGIPF